MRHFSSKRIIDTVVTYLLLIVISFIFVFPCGWLILASFSKSGNLYDYKGFIPERFGLDSFKTLFTDTSFYNYPNWFRNTLLVAIASAFFGTLLVILTAYTMSRFRFKGRKAVMKGTLILGMFPSFMGMVAVYIIAQQFGLVNKLWALVLIYSSTSPLAYLTQKGFYDTIPNSIDEAAMIDGANNLQVFTRINLPLSMPIIIYTALTSFTFPWSDFVLPKLLLKDKNLWTVAVGLTELPDTEFARFASGAVFIAVPIIILYFILIRYMVDGMVSGAVKG